MLSTGANMMPTFITIKSSIQFTQLWGSEINFLNFWNFFLRLQIDL